MSYATLQAARRQFAAAVAAEFNGRQALSPRLGYTPPAPRPTRKQSGDCDGGSCSACKSPFVVNAQSKIPVDMPALNMPCVLLGYTSVTGLPYEYDGRLEQMRPGCFAGYLATGWPVEARFAHSAADVLGGTTDGTLALREDSFGVLVALQANSEKARQVATLVRRGEVAEMSIGRCQDGTTGRYRLGQQVQEHKHGRISEVSFLAAGANPATCALAVCKDDLLAADPWSEQSLLNQERRLEWEAMSWARDALTKTRRQRGRLRLQRLGAMLLQAGIFESFRGTHDRGEIIRRGLEAM